MTRQTSIAASFSFLLFSAACGPAPVGPRAGALPPDPPKVDADVPSPPPDTADAGAETASADAPDIAASADAGAPDVSASADAGGPDAPADVASIDAVVEAPSARPPIAGELLIVEALVNPGGSDSGHEWIEIVSRAAEPVDLAELHLADATIDVPAPAGVVAGGARLVLGQSLDPSKNGGAPVAVAYGTRLALNNDGEQIAICIGACATGLVIDRVEWKVLGAGFDGHAVVFDRDAGAICPATEPFGTAGDHGTPGSPNDGCAAPDAGF